MINIKGKKILVTGADGFIGSHLVEKLYKDGANVKALSCYNSFNYWGWLEETDCLKEIEVVNGDIRDSAFCRAIVRNADIVYNLAALIAIPYSYTAPDSYVDTNVKGALNICSAARDYDVTRVIQMSTSEVYGTAQYVPIDENHPLQPQSPYSASKIGADAVAMSFYHAFNLPVTIARPFNAYGPRQSARAVIPAVITQIASGASSIKLGDITPTRDFSYVGDTCKGLTMLGQCDEAVGEICNIGTGFEISIAETVNKIKEIMNSNIETITDDKRMRPKGSEVRRLWCDNSKLKKLTGFHPDYTLEDGLKLTIDWFTQSKNLSKYKAEIYNV